MELFVNGKPYEVDEGATVAGLVDRLGFTVRNVVVERNGEPVARSAMRDTRLEPGDVLEVVRPVQGGAPDALERARIYLCAPAGVSLDTLEEILAEGVGVLQLREKVHDAAPIVREAERYASVCDRFAVPFVVNDRPDIALAVSADGVHLGQDDLAPAVARDILGPDVLIGRSTHSIEQIDAAIAEHEAGLADYIAVGPVHETPTAPGRPATGTDLVRYAAGHVTFPWFAIGGIDASNVAGVVSAGARRIVVVRAILDAPDPPAATRELREALG